MLIRRLILISLSLVLLSQTVLAESAGYHLKRLEIQARAFLAQLDPAPAPQQAEGMPVEEQLEMSVQEQSTWAEDMVKEDLASVISAVPQLLESIESGDEDEYSRARTEVESLARRLRISTSPLQLDPQQQAGLELLMLELEEASAVMKTEREQRLAQRDSQRRRSRVSVGVGYGWGGWGGWGPWGYGSWGPWGYGGGYYRPVRVYRRPYCR